MQDYRKLKVWDKSHQLALQVYSVTSAFPRSELYGLTSQLRRSCASIPANIAEGCGRGGKPELAQFLQVAMGSANEIEYHLLLARDLGFLGPREYEPLVARTLEIQRMLATFIRRLRGPVAARGTRDPS